MECLVSRCLAALARSKGSLGVVIEATVPLCPELAVMGGGRSP